MGRDGYERDPGLAAERTEMAWGRSALALFVCGAAVARGLPGVTGAPGRPAAGVALCVIGGLAWLAGVPYARQRAHPERRPTAGARPRALLLMSLGTAAVGLGALIIDIVLPA